MCEKERESTKHEYKRKQDHGTDLRDFNRLSNLCTSKVTNRFVGESISFARSHGRFDSFMATIAAAIRTAHTNTRTLRTVHVSRANKILECDVGRTNKSEAAIYDYIDSNG